MASMLEITIVWLEKALVLVLRFPKSLPWIAVLILIRLAAILLVDVLNFDSALQVIMCALRSFLHLVEEKLSAFLLIRKICFVLFNLLIYNTKHFL